MEYQGQKRNRISNVKHIETLLQNTTKNTHYKNSRPALVSVKGRFNAQKIILITDGFVLHSLYHLDEEQSS